MKKSNDVFSEVIVGVFMVAVLALLVYFTVVISGVDLMMGRSKAIARITVKGPKGTLHSKFHPLMTVKVEGNEILVTRPNDEKEARSLHGLTRTNIRLL